MRLLPQTGVHATSIFTLFSYFGDISPHKEASRELSEDIIDESIEATKPNISIYVDT